MKQVVIISGKGGTGKTTLTAAFIALSENKLVADCDVDAADLHILLNPVIHQSHVFIGGKKAKIDPQRCTECGLCETYCRFDAIHNFVVDPIACEGCGFCVRLCPDDAIDFKVAPSGNYYESVFGDSEFFHAKLIPGEGNSGKLVSQVKKQAEKTMRNNNREWYFVDGPPGIGCPVNASLTEADFVVAVTEPTISGLHDLERLIKLIERFKIPTGVVINKHDLNQEMTQRIERYAIKSGLTVLGTIPFDEQVVKSLLQKKIITEFPDSIAAREIKTIWTSIQLLLDEPKRSYTDKNIKN
ncbi:hypothetical protein B1H10_05160 [candidate division KSB1 bacterium 4484_188]|nr:MAG: hypothetical protein B1H10_05160 [candidate division KSB1 bacterium 4484_188]HFE63504.1 (4Fe-4S)-binding protein [Caldithrix sp.]